MTSASHSALFRSGRAAFLVFGVASLGAVLCGVLAAQAAGVPPALTLRNAAAWAGGLVLAFALARSPKSGSPLVFVAPAILCIAATFAGPGQADVYRWMKLGPLMVNAAELTLPLAIAALPALIGRHPAFLAIPAGLSILLGLQPDASQAVALAVAVTAIVAVLDMTWLTRAMAVIVPVLSAVAAVTRRDPLQPVPEVEGIVGLAWQTSPVLAVAGILCLGAAAATPIACARSGPSAGRAAAVGLAGYMAAVAFAPVLGAFPVPLMGMGVSPIIGAWLAIGWLTKCTLDPFEPIHD